MDVVKKLNTLPDDILLSILAFVGLKDLLVFPLVCSAFRTAVQNRVVWINTLKAERRLRPIACPAYQDLSHLSLAELKHIACHSLRVQGVWTTEHRRSLPVAGPITVIVLVPSLPEDDDEGLALPDPMFQVPGTEYHTFHSRQTGELVVWDITKGRPVTEGLYVGNRIMDVSAGWQAEGKFWMGMLISHSASYACHKMLIVCLEYNAYSAPSLTVTFEVDFDEHLHHWAIFMNMEYIGALECASPPDLTKPADACIRITAFNIATGRQILITTDIPRDFGVSEGTHSGTSTSNGDTFVLFENSERSFVYLLPTHILPHDANIDIPPAISISSEQWAATVVWETTDEDENNISYIAEAVLSANEQFGYPAVSMQLKDLEADEVTARYVLQVIFWTPGHRPVSPGRDPTTGAASLIPKWAVDVPGMLLDTADSAWRLTYLSHTGRAVLLVMDGDDETQLRLAIVDPTLNKCVLHQLAVPGLVDLDFVYSMSIDDHKGIVTLLDSRGMLFAIPYV